MSRAVEARKPFTGPVGGAPRTLCQWPPNPEYGWHTSRMAWPPVVSHYARAIPLTARISASSREEVPFSRNACAMRSAMETERSRARSPFPPGPAARPGWLRPAWRSPGALGPSPTSSPPGAQPVSGWACRHSTGSRPPSTSGLCANRGSRRASRFRLRVPCHGGACCRPRSFKHHRPVEIYRPE